MVERGSIVLVAFKGDYQKVRPAVIVQSDESTTLFNSLTLCLMTSTEAVGSLLRVPVEPDLSNGLVRQSWVQTEKVMTIPQTKAGKLIGRLSEAQMTAVDISLATHLNLFALSNTGA